MPPKGTLKLTPEERRAVGTRIAERRRAKQWSQREFGRRTGITFTRISKLETGQATPSLAELLLVATTLDAGLDELGRGVLASASSAERYLLPPLQELEDFASPAECAILGKLLRVLLAGFKATATSGTPEPHGEQQSSSQVEVDR
jgi:transcriptional regulator with XRE-family HTH domain